MRTPTWEAAAGALAALLNGEATQLRMADLYSFTLSGGAVHRYSAADEPVTLGERAFLRGPLLSRGTTRIGPGIAVEELQVTDATKMDVSTGKWYAAQYAGGRRRRLHASAGHARLRDGRTTCSA